MTKIITYANQTPFDIALQELGGFEAAFDIMVANPVVFPSITAAANPKKTVDIKALPVNKDVLNFYKNGNEGKGIHPVSSTQAIVSSSSSFTPEFSPEFL